MKLSAIQLSAFFQTARLRSFSKAADELGITQSALSQRVAKLEEDLEVTLFVRDTSGPQLTEAGELLLRHTQTTQSLEDEILHQLKSGTKSLAGSVRMAGFSSILRSVIIPSLAPFLRTQPQLLCEFRSYEVKDLPDILKSAQADYIVLDYHLGKKGIAEHVLGKEEYVVVESAKYNSPEDVYLDHGSHDNATESFFDQQLHRPQFYRRSFMGDVYGIIDGVAQGLGRAVMSRHLIENEPRIKMVKGFKRFFRDITLNYYEQPYYTRLHHEIIKAIQSRAGDFLA